MEFAEMASAVNSQSVPLSRELELERVIGLLQVRDLSGLSVDTIKRNHADKIIQLSKRRRGMKLKHALSLHVSAA
jgi:hypothetical protein